MDDNDQIDSTAAEGEPRSEERAELPTDTADASGASVILNLEGLIKNHTSTVQRLREEAGKLTDILNDILENDPVYKEHAEAAKEASRIKTATKNQILKQPQAADVVGKLKTIKSEVKESNEALSDYLREYNRLSGLTEIEGDDGRIRSIIYIAKLVDRGSTR